MTVATEPTATEAARAAHIEAQERLRAAQGALGELQARVAAVPERRAELRRTVAATSGAKRLDAMASLIETDESEGPLAAEVAAATAELGRVGHGAVLAEHAWLTLVDNDQEAEARAMRERQAAEREALGRRHEAEDGALQERRGPTHRRLMELEDARRAALAALREGA
jgi:hypothetical protein